MNTAIPLMPPNELARKALTFRQPVRRGTWRRWRRIMSPGYVLLTVAFAHRYLPGLSPTLVLGIVAIFYSPNVDTPGAAFRFGWPALLFTTLFFVIPLKTLAFAGLVCAVACYRETFYRRVPATTFFILALLTPVAGYFADTFSFPIRLWLTSAAGSLLRITGAGVTTEGNAITYRLHQFSVDPACMGLHMLVMSLLSALLIMNYYQRQEQRRLSTVVIAALLTLSIILNILANLLRIVCLVVFLILPENPFHGIFGLLVLGAYVLLPLLPMIRYAIHRFGHPVLPANGSPITVRSRWVLAGNTLLLAGMLPLTALTLLNKDPRQQALANMTIPGYTLRVRPNGITQLDNSRSMVYIKPIPGFYYTDHTPSICWEGSGYTFTTLRVTTIANLALFEGVLEKGKEKLYTAWWYDDGTRQTINPFVWRWDYFRGRGHYAVVNVTAATQPQLEAEVTRILKTHPFLPLLCHN